MSEQKEKRFDDLQPGDLVSISIVGRIEKVSKSGYIVSAHGAEIPILKSSVKEVFKPEEQQVKTQ
jgi:preprotein translocase subunit YajC